MGCTPNSSRKEIQDAIIAKPRNNLNASPSRVEELKIGASSFIVKKEGEMKENYTLGAKLGSGAFGFVRLGTHRMTGQKRAIKTISKDSIEFDMADRARFFTEVDILKEADHPNIVRLYEFYEDENFFHLVTEYVEGGELFDFIVESKLLSEPIAAHFMKQLLSAVSYCHSNNIVHRDLKPENLLLDRESPDATLKVIDFGTSAVIDQTSSLSQRFGTAYYIAPEVLLKDYNEKCDIWSCGVIMYILLSGKPPFYGRQDKDILRKVSKGEYSFRGNEWKTVSDSAKKLIEKMLDLNPRTRISATEAMQDEWIITSVQGNTGDVELAQLSLNNIQNFKAEQKLQHAVLTFIASELLSKEQLSRLAETFRQVDTNGDGKLSEEELLEAYSKIMGLESAHAEVRKIMLQVDVNNSGFIDYTEFIMASTQKEVLLSKENIDKAFMSFDTDGNGKISAEEVKRMFGDMEGSDTIWTDLIAEVDENGDGEVDITEFKAMMMKLFDLE